MIKKILVYVLLLFFIIPPVATLAETKAFNDQYIKVVGNNELPYPGLLPDSPLYFLKMIRDRFVSFSTQNPASKVDFDILQAEKRLNAGVYLFIQRKDHSLATSTISKGSNYFNNALIVAENAKKQKEDIKDLKRKISKSLLKYKYVLKNLKSEKSEQIKKSLEETENKIANFEKRTNSL
ncbi:DUF5667 domain-containing protein [Patescibacteria group bacterium]|nr:DUF5667 domain-containing protein [Patescibacteria group bacterium]